MSKKKRKNRSNLFEIPALKNASETLLANIRFSSVDNDVKTITITSSLPDEGKTTVCTNLACAMAGLGKKVLVIDCDMRLRLHGPQFDSLPSRGIYSVLSGQAALENAIIPTSHDNVFLMNSEPNIPNPPDLLSSQRFTALMDLLRDKFDYVLLDTPPLLTFIDAAIAASLTDGTILVVRNHRTKRAAVADAIQQLQTADARILGAVMTFTPERDESYYYYSYYKDSETHASSTDGAHGDESFSAWADREDIDINEQRRNMQRKKRVAKTSQENYFGNEGRWQSPRIDSPNLYPYPPDMRMPLHPRYKDQAIRFENAPCAVDVPPFPTLRRQGMPADSQNYGPRPVPTNLGRRAFRYAPTNNRTKPIHYQSTQDEGVQPTNDGRTNQ